MPEARVPPAERIRQGEAVAWTRRNGGDSCLMACPVLCKRVSAHAQWGMPGRLREIHTCIRYKFLMGESRKQQPVSPPHQEQWEQKTSTSNPITSTPWPCPQMASVSMPPVSWPGMPHFVSMPSVLMPPVSMPSALNLFLARMAGARQHPLPQVPDYSRHYPLYRPHPPPAQQSPFSTNSSMKLPMFQHHIQLTQLGYDIKRDRNRCPNMYPSSSVPYQPYTNPYQRAPNAYQSFPTPLPLPVERKWTGAPIHHHEEKLEMEQVPYTVQYQRASLIQNTRNVIQNYPTTKNVSMSPVHKSTCTV